MPKTEDLISQISAEITQNNGEFWMPKIDLDYMHTDRPNYPQTHQDIACSPSLAAISPDTTGSRRDSTAYQTYQRYFKNKVLEFKSPG